MRGRAKEHWMKLCEQAATEKDPEKLLALVEEINRMLEEKEDQLNNQRIRGSANAASEKRHADKEGHH